MNVKRTIAIILILSIIVVAVFALSGCNITNDGSEDELKGIYGVTTMYYKSYEGKKYNVSGQYEYFLLVLNGDEGRTGKVIMKRDGDAEFSYDITYTPKFNSDGKTIWSITVNDSVCRNTRTKRARCAIPIRPKGSSVFIRCTKRSRSALRFHKWATITG